MKNMTFFISTVLFLICSVSCDKDFTKNQDNNDCTEIKPNPDINISLINEAVLTLANDSMFGRSIKYSGIEKAQKYITNTLEELGVATLNSTYLEPFSYTESYPSEISISINGNLIPAENIAIHPLKKEQNLALNNIDSVYLFNSDSSFLNQANRLVDSLWYNTIKNRNYLVLVPSIFINEMRTLQNLIKELTTYKVSLIGTETFSITFGLNNIFFILTDEIQINSFEAYFKYCEKVQNNIVGVIPGKSRSSQIVIFSAHFDGQGIIPNQKDSIKNSANDNASGVAANLALAEYYIKKQNNERTLWFVFFNLEENGLLGSKAFVKNHLNDNIITNINFDMIGYPTLEDGNAYLTGYDKSNMGSIFSQNLKCTNFAIMDDMSSQYSLFKRSDNYSFYEYNIPAHTIMTFNGSNYEYYHGLYDDIDKINFNVIYNVVMSTILGATTIVNGEEIIVLN